MKNYLKITKFCKGFGFCEDKDGKSYFFHISILSRNNEIPEKGKIIAHYSLKETKVSFGILYTEKEYELELKRDEELKEAKRIREEEERRIYSEKKKLENIDFENNFQKCKEKYPNTIKDYRSLYVLDREISCEISGTHSICSFINDKEKFFDAEIKITKQYQKVNYGILGDYFQESQYVDVKIALDLLTIIDSEPFVEWKDTTFYGEDTWKYENYSPTKFTKREVNKIKRQVIFPKTFFIEIEGEVKEVSCNKDFTYFIEIK